MVGYFPPIYKNELFYSTIARYHYHSGNSSLSQTIRDIFDKKQIKANVEFASKLDVLSEKLSKFNYISKNEIIDKHTMFPYFSFFIDSSLRKELKQVLMEGDNLNKLYLKFGLQGHKVKTHSFLKFCPKCFAEDLMDQGEGYWRLDHQLPSSYICLIHGETLVDSSVSFRHKNKTEFVAANSENCNKNSKNEDIELIRNHYTKFEAITQAGLDLTRSSSNLKYNNLHQMYRNILGSKGYLSANGSVKQIKLGNAFEKFYGTQILSFLNCNVNPGDNSCWLRLITSRHRSIFHPLYHILLLTFLNVSIGTLNSIEKPEYKPFGIGPFPCLNPAADHYRELIIRKVKVRRDRNTGNPRGLFSCSCGYEYVRIGPDRKKEDIYTYNKVFEYGHVWKERLFRLVQNQRLTYKEAAEKLHVSHQTVRRYLNNFKKKTKQPAPILSKLDILKERWMTLLKENPSYSQDQIRNQDKGLYTLLYKYDKEWLKENSPVFVPFSMGNNRVNWEERDQQYFELIKKTVDKIKNIPDKPERITINKIEVESGLLFLSRNLDKLPRISKYIKSNIESLSEFQIRKAKWAIKHLENNNEDVTLSKIKQLLNVHDSLSNQVIERINGLIFS